MRARRSLLIRCLALIVVAARRDRAGCRIQSLQTDSRCTNKLSTQTSRASYFEESVVPISIRKSFGVASPKETADKSQYNRHCRTRRARCCIHARQPMVKQAPSTNRTRAPKNMFNQPLMVSRSKCCGGSLPPRTSASIALIRAASQPLPPRDHCRVLQAECGSMPPAARPSPPPIGEPEPAPRPRRHLAPLTPPVPHVPSARESAWFDET